MPRVIYIDKSVLPKSRSKNAPRVVPPAPTSDLLAVRIRPQSAMINLIAPISAKVPAPKPHQNVPKLAKQQPARKSPENQASPKPQAQPAVKAASKNHQPVTPSPAQPLVYVQKIPVSPSSTAQGNQTKTTPGKPKASRTRRGIAKAAVVLKAVYPKVKSLVGKINANRARKKQAKLARKQAAAAAKANMKAIAKAKQTTVAKAKAASLKPKPQPKSTVKKQPAQQKIQAKTQNRPPSPKPQRSKSPTPGGAGQQPPSRPRQKNGGLAYDFSGNNPRPALPDPVTLPQPINYSPAPATKPAKPQARQSIPQVAPPSAPKKKDPVSKSSLAAQTPTTSSPAGSPKTRPQSQPQTQRLLSLDAYRGFIMLVMAGGGFGIVQMAGQAGTDPNWDIAAWFFKHVSWVGMSIWDLIQPAFMFMVGVAAPFSYARRKELGQSWIRMLNHAVYRSLALILLGVFIQSRNASQTNWLFTNVLTQIGLGYIVVFLLCGKGRVTQLVAAAAILIGYAGAFYVHVGPESGLTLGDLGMTQADVLPEMLEPYSRHINFAASFDRWFLNLFPRAETWTIHPGGYQTLNFIPSIATMLLGLVAGELLRGKDTPSVKFQKLLLAGVPCLVIGIFAGVTFCPIVKRIWTPSWALFSGAFVIWGLAIFYYFIDVRGWRWWSWPLVIVGMNSIAIYLMAVLMKPWFANVLLVHFNPQAFNGHYGPVVERCSILALMWLVCLFLYRKKLFVRV